MGPPRSFMVLGGGLSGLSAALHLSRRFPARTGIRITLLEKSSRLGGWVQSERVRVKDKHGHEAEILLESGPRTLRPASKAILEIVSIFTPVVTYLLGGPLRALLYTINPLRRQKSNVLGLGRNMYFAANDVVLDPSTQLRVVPLDCLPEGSRCPEPISACPRNQGPSDDPGFAPCSSRLALGEDPGPCHVP